MSSPAQSVGICSHYGNAILKCSLSGVPRFSSPLCSFMMCPSPLSSWAVIQWVDNGDYIVTAFEVALALVMGVD